MRDGDGHAALGGAIELGEDDAGHAGDVGELARLLHAVLADRRVEHEQHFVRRPFGRARRDAPDLVELVHQVDAVVQPARRVDQHRIAALRLARLDGVEHDRRRIGAFLRADDVDVRARCAQISSCSTAAARNVSAAQTSGCLPDAFSRLASLPIVVVLPVPLTPTISVTCG